MIYERPDIPVWGCGRSPTTAGSSVMLVNKGTEERELLYLSHLGDPMAAEDPRAFNRWSISSRRSPKWWGRSVLYVVTALNAARYKSC